MIDRLEIVPAIEAELRRVHSTTRWLLPRKHRASLILVEPPEPSVSAILRSKSGTLQEEKRKKNSLIAIIDDKQRVGIVSIIFTSNLP